MADLTCRECKPIIEPVGDLDAMPEGKVTAKWPPTIALCPKHAEADELRKQLEEAQQSLMRHFNEEHLTGDGPEIDRWKAKNRTLEKEVERLRGAAQAVVDACDIPGVLHNVPIEQLKDALKRRG